jgi:4-cresol dehydrogenase (hydroxylating)
VFQQLVFDREPEGQDAAALACHHEVFEYIVSAGLTPHRLDTLHMAALGPRADAGLYRKVKRALDPNGIVAPGRYSF